MTQTHDELVRIRFIGRIDHRRGIFDCVENIFSNRSIEENRFLSNHGDLPMQIFMIVLLNFMPIDADFASARIVETFQ